MSKNSHLAYGPERHALEAVMRLHAVKRWHMIDTTRIQTLAEHSANVAMLAMMIAMSSPMHFFDDPMLIAATALVHDLPEAFTGDVPTHTKRYITGLDELEKEVTPGLFNISAGTRSMTLIKLCDLADGIRFIRLHGVDATAKHARAGLEQQLNLKLTAVSFPLEGVEIPHWPEAVFKHVRSNIMFYAYENS